MMTKQTEQQQQQPVPILIKPPGGRSGSQELRMKELIHVLLKRRTWILLGMIFGMVSGLSLSVFSYVRAQTIKQYSIKTSIALTSQDQNGLFSRQSRDPDSTDIHLAEDMVDTAIYILRSDTMLNKIIEDVNLLGVTAHEISASMSMNQYQQTQIILINLYWENATEGVKILDAMNRLAPSLLINTLKLGSVTVINDPTARFVIGGNLNLMRNLVLGVIVGGMISAGLAVLELILRPTLLTLSDVEKKFRIPLLGTVVEHTGEVSVLTELLGQTDGTMPRSELADSFLALAYALKRRLGEQEHACLLLTSAERGEGKTVATACLAAALSRIGARVLAVDFNFRNPMLAGLFFRQMNPIHSVNALYQGRTVPRDAVMPVSGTLDVLPALLERNPMQLDTATMDLIRLMRDEYDVVLLDTPPVGQIADTMALNELTQLALFVMQYDAVTQTELQKALKRLESVEIDVLGGVVTRVPSTRGGDHRSRQSDGKLRHMLEKYKGKLKFKGLRKLWPKR